MLGWTLLASTAMAQATSKPDRPSVQPSAKPSGRKSDPKSDPKPTQRPLGKPNHKGTHASHATQPRAPQGPQGAGPVKGANPPARAAAKPAPTSPTAPAKRLAGTAAGAAAAGVAGAAAATVPGQPPASPTANGTVNTIPTVNPTPNPTPNSTVNSTVNATANPSANVTPNSEPTPTPKSAANAAPVAGVLRAARAQLPSAPGDDAFVIARNAFVASDINRLSVAAASVDAAHPLRPYVDAWRLRLQLNESRFDADGSVRIFLDRFAGTFAADGVRRDWVLSLARRGLWSEFEQQYPRLAARGPDDPQPGCADARRRALTGDPIALTAARDALPLGRELGETCAALLEQLAGQGVLSQADLWRRLLAAVDGGALTAVRKFAALLPTLEEGRALNAALDQPQSEILVAPSANFRELVVIALARQARNEPQQAAERLMRYGPRLTDDDRAWVWAQVAAAGARRLHPDAAQWAHRGAIVAGAGVPLGTVSDETLAWLARAGLRSRDWKLVRGAIERMTETGRADPAWRYWWAKSVAAEGRTEEANQQMRAIAGPWSFYGLLAADELALVQTLPARPPAASDEELAEVMGHSGVIRALKFSDLSLRPESVKEMAFTVRTLSDRQILALSEALRRRGLHDRSIAVAERTVATHDAGLRFPTPYRDLVSEAARAQDLEPAFVYGLVRQESRFLAEARSGVGAAGLMQLMPATAKWVARKVGANSFTPGRIHEPDLNLRFGSFYLRRVLDELDGSPMLAAAAYNAGPGRPKAWRASLPVGVEGAAFAETIPFTETRDYVKKVLANSVAYAALLEPGTTGQRLPSLKNRLGQVAPRAAVPGEAP